VLLKDTHKFLYWLSRGGLGPPGPPSGYAPVINRSINQLSISQSINHSFVLCNNKNALLFQFRRLYNIARKTTTIKHKLVYKESLSS